MWIVIVYAAICALAKEWPEPARISYARDELAARDAFPNFVLYMNTLFFFCWFAQLIYCHDNGCIFFSNFTKH